MRARVDVRAVLIACAHCARTWRRIRMQDGVQRLQVRGVHAQSLHAMHLPKRVRVTIDSRNARMRDAPRMHVHARGVAFRRRRSPAPRSRASYGLSHHTLPVMSVLPCADFAAARLLALSEFSIDRKSTRL